MNTPIRRQFAAGEITVIAQQHTPVSKTDADTNEAVLYTLTIPAGMMGLNDTLRITHKWTFPNSATTKTPRLKIGETTVYGLGITTNAGMTAQHVLSNRNSLTSQVSVPTASVQSYGGNAFSFTNIDFSVNQVLTMSAQWGTAGEGANNITLESVFIELIKGV